MNPPTTPAKSRRREELVSKGQRSLAAHNKQTNKQPRIFTRNVQTGKRNYSDAAKLFSSVAVLIQDEVLTPRALNRAAQSYLLASDAKNADAALDRLRKEFPTWEIRT